MTFIRSHNMTFTMQRQRVPRNAKGRGKEKLYENYCYPMLLIKILLGHPVMDGLLLLASSAVMRARLASMGMEEEHHTFPLLKQALPRALL